MHIASYYLPLLALLLQPCLSHPATLLDSIQSVRSLNSDHATSMVVSNDPHLLKRTPIEIGETSNLTANDDSHRRRYRVDFERRPSTSMRGAISTSYLRGFFTKELRTDVSNALKDHSSESVPARREWYAKTIYGGPFISAPRFQVLCTPSPDATEDTFTLGLIRDFFDEAPYWILNTEDWDDDLYKAVQVDVLDAADNVGWKTSAWCRIETVSKLGQWDDASIYSDLDWIEVIRGKNRGATDRSNNLHTGNVTAVSK